MPRRRPRVSTTGNLFGEPASPPPPVAPAAAAAGSYARVAVKLPIRRLFHYQVPGSLQGRVRPGHRVKVPFHGRQLVGYVVDLCDSTEAPGRTRSLASLVDEEPLVTADLLELALWMSDRYLASVGECLEAILPAGVRWDRQARREQVVRRAMGAALLQEQMEELEARFPGRALLLRLLLQHEDHLARQLDRPPTEAEMEVPVRPLLARAQVSISPLRTLEKHGLVVTSWRPYSGQLPPDASEIAPEDSHVPERLTFEQEAALQRLHAALTAGMGGSFLLHGVTGSGKTEIYLRVIARSLQEGRGAIVLVPEIALTPQVVQRFASRFSRIAVLHSGLSDAERNRAWNRIRRGQVDVVIGPRSAVFAPLPELGLVVLDEEHETTFKQDATPRYHAREVALFRARQARALVILGSATPSLESYRDAQRLPGCPPPRHTLLSLPSRVSGRPMPPVTVVNLREEFLAQERRVLFSRLLVERTRQALEREEQVIYFLNRRGYSTYLHCTRCGFTLSCTRCEIKLTYHRQLERAWCHHCGYTTLPPRVCPECQMPNLRYWGFGTERLVQEVQEVFPGVRLERMDSDTMTTRESYARAFRNLREGKVDLLLGTQMIAKGLDLPRVTVVGVLYADIALAFPDFRAAERTFQLIAQVAGRTGRGERGGEVIVQCFRPDHYAIAAARSHDYESFARAELEFRRQLGYPPWGHLVRILCEGKDRERVQSTSDLLAGRLRELEGRPGTPRVGLLGPADAPIPRLKDRWRRHLLLKLADEEELLRFNRELADDLLQVRGASEVRITIDVDPTAML